MQANRTSAIPTEELEVASLVSHSDMVAFVEEEDEEEVVVAVRNFFEFNFVGKERHRHFLEGTTEPRNQA